ncbi:MAG: M48 family metallopeptidase [Leptospiraceae bacterium]|nr:M48 family metallopeptidase [Leptospiraceae bacterium]
MIQGLTNCFIEYNPALGAGYRLSVEALQCVRIEVADRRQANNEMAARLLHKHRRFIQRRINAQSEARVHTPPPACTAAQAMQLLQGDFDHWQSAMQLPRWSLVLRHAKTRWGSCSHRTRRIMINVQAVHLLAELRHYLIIHELAHIRYRGHGRRFWQFVARFDPDYKEHRQRLRQDYGWLLAITSSV